MVRMLWALFAASVIAVVCLCVFQTPSGDRLPTAGIPATADVDAPDEIAAPAAAGKADPEERETVRGDDALALSAGAAATTASAENEGLAAGADGDSEASPADASRPTPEEFLEHLIELAQKGDLEALMGHVSPGVARATRGLLALIVARKSGAEVKELDRIFEEVGFELEELDDGSVRVRAEGPEGGPSEDLYLVPRDGSWELAAESDLPGPAAERRQALNRLQLLALSQYTFLSEDLGGVSRYAGTVRELATGLNRSPVYEDVLQPDFIRAVDAAYPYGSYAFGRIESGAEGFGYYATPAVYRPGVRETLLIDASGRVWGKDLQGEPAPSTWPGPDPAEQGWTKRRGIWR